MIKNSRIIMLMLLLASASNVFSRQEINIQVIGASAFVRDTVRLADDKLFINAAGSGIRDTSDNCVFAYANSFGDFEFQAGVSLEGLVNKGEAGLMVREQTTPASPFLAIVNTAGGCYILYRSVQAGLVGAARISTTSIPFLKIKRTGGNFFFYYKSEESASFTVWPAAYKMNISPSVYIGFVAASNSNNSSAAVFDGISGLPSEKNTYNKNTCEARLIDFNSADNMASAGLDAFSFWELDSGFIYSTTPGGTVSSDAGLMNFTAARGDSPLSFSWKMYVDSDDAPQLSDYVLFGSEGLHIGHRVYTAGRYIGSGGPVEIGIDSKTSSINAAGNVTLWDRAAVDGNITTAADITIMNQVSVSGSIQTRTAVELPAVPVKTVFAGTVNRYLYWGDSVDLAPGSYGEVVVYQNAKIRFRAGVYNFSNLKFEPGARVYLEPTPDSPLELNVRDELRIGDRTGFVLSDPAYWYNVHIYSDQTNQMSIGTDLTLYGYIYAPRAQVTLYSRELTVFGGIYGRRIVVEPDSRFTIDTFYGESSRLKVVFGDAVKDGRNYTLQYLIDGDSLRGDFSFYYDSTLMFDNKPGAAAPFRRWLTFTVEFHKTAASGGDGTIRLLFDTGHGNMLIKELNHDSIGVFSNLSFQYTTGAGRFNRRIRLDDIIISCTQQPCVNAVILEQPQKNTAVYESAPVSFKFGLENPRDYEYQWYKNSGIISGAKEPVLFIPAATAADSGASFYCRASGDCDTAVSDTAFLFIKRCSIPQIHKSPTSVNVNAGDTAKFYVHVTGSGLRYVWYENDRPVPNSDSKILRVASVRLNQNMSEYKVKITNECGESVLSSAAVLRVREPEICKITAHPKSDTLEEGETFILEAKSGCGSALWSWLKNGLVISGQTKSQLIYERVTMSDSGSVFRVVVSNRFGSDTSDAAVLHVVKKKPGSKILAVSGMLYDGNGDPVGGGYSVSKNFQVKLFTSKIGGKEVYSENFYDQRSIVVDSSGQFTVQLGRGFTKDNLQNVFVSHNNLYAEIYAGDETGQLECLGPRLKFTAAPYSMQTGVNIIYGSGDPVTEAALGTLFVDAGGSGATWIRKQAGWTKLD